MRALITCQPGSGHWHPLVPFAQALEAAGHEVAFASTPDTCSAVMALGFQAFPAGVDETTQEIAERQKQQDERSPRDRAAFMWTKVFAGSRAESRLPNMLALMREWRPDVVLRELTEFTGCIAAERLGIPHATVQVVARRPDIERLVVPQLTRLRESVGLPPDPNLDMLYRYLFLSPRPPSFQDPDAPPPPTTHLLRYIGFNRSSDDHLPEWIGEMPDRPTVYATLGTVVNQLTGLFPSLLEALREEPINLILTVGRNMDPDSFGPQPAHVHIESYIPQSLLLPHCDLVINHGGSGTVMDALSHGLPMVIIPIGADQPVNARNCARMEVARVIEPDNRTTEAIRSATQDVLGDPRYRRNAERVRDEIEVLPGLDHAVTLLERLAAERAPILAASSA